MSPLDRHLTTEQLSALLDNQLSPDEAEESYQAHLQTCEQCQQELDELRQTVRLLRALPQPPLPRSFTLPANFASVATASATDTSAQKDALPNSVKPEEIRRVGSLTLVPVRRKRLRTTMRLVSGLVAAIGIFCVLLSFSRASMLSGTTATSSSGVSQQKSSSVTGQGAGRVPRTPTSVGTPYAVQNPASTPHVVQGPTTTVPTQPSDVPQGSGETPSVIQSTFTFFDIGTAIGIFRLGILLLVLGLFGFFLFKQRETRYRPQTAPHDQE